MIKRFLSFILALCLSISLISPTSISASVKQEDYILIFGDLINKHNGYNNKLEDFLQENYTVCDFAFFKDCYMVDMNNDSIPELLCIFCDEWGPDEYAVLIEYDNGFKIGAEIPFNNAITPAGGREFHRILKANGKFYYESYSSTRIHNGFYCKEEISQEITLNQNGYNTIVYSSQSKDFIDYEEGAESHVVYVNDEKVDEFNHNYVVDNFEIVADSNNYEANWIGHKPQFGKDYTKFWDDNETITVTIDGKTISFDQPPIIVSGRTLVPVRAVVEAMGGEVCWDDVTQTATLILGEDIIKLTIDNTTAYLNDEEKILDVAPQIINSRTLMPIRFVAESFDYQVDWDEETQTVLIRRMFSAEEDNKNTLAIATFTEFLKDFQQKPIEIQAMPYNLILTDDNYLTTTLEILSYELFDIDMDGQTELIVSGKILSPEYNMGGSCFSAWDINEKNEIVKIFAKAGMNSRTTWRYNFLENNGEILLCESAGMSNSVSRVTHRILYKIKDGEIMPYLSVDYDDSSEYYTINDQPVSEEEALNMVEEIDNYKRVVMQAFE